MAIKYIDFYGLKLSIIEKDPLLDQICNTIINDGKLVIFGYSLGSFRILKRYPIMYSFAWEKADIMMVDGRGLYVLGKLLGFPFKEDLSIPQLSNELLLLADQKNFSILLLGTEADINNTATQKIRNKFRNITVFDGIDGFFKIEEEEEIVNKINSVNPDILFVGISSPKKEEFIARWKDKLNVRIILLCGGVIDIFAGDKKQTPNWLKKIGGASIYRFIQEPGRLYKYFFPFILFFLFSFLPAIIYQVILKRNIDFSIPKYYKVI